MVTESITQNLKVANNSYLFEREVFMAEERSSIIISIFSTTPGIGKTVTAINLTAALAQEGYKVCLVW